MFTLFPYTYIKVAREWSLYWINNVLLALSTYFQFDRFRNRRRIAIVWWRNIDQYLRSAERTFLQNKYISLRLSSFFPLFVGDRLVIVVIQREMRDHCCRRAIASFLSFFLIPIYISILIEQPRTQLCVRPALFTSN